MAAPTPLINGNRYYFASIEISFQGRRFVGVKSVNYSSSQEPGEVRGTAPQLIGRTRGKYTADASFEMYRVEWSDFATFLLSNNPGNTFLPQGADPRYYGIHDMSFDIAVSFAEAGSPVVTDKIIGCRIKKIASDNSDGADASTIKSDLHVMSITWGSNNNTDLRSVGDINTQGQGGV